MCKSHNFSKNKLYIIEILEGSTYLIELTAFHKKKLPTYFIGDQGEAKSYLRGVFLNSGSVNDPKTSRYHMELLVSNPEEAVFVQKVLNMFDLNAKLLNRDKGYMIYLKEAEKISDFLKILGTMQAVLYYEDVRIYREQKNNTNRLNNCEQANTERAVSTALEQLNYIKIIRENLAVELLDDKTKQTLIYREKYKEASLKELSEIIGLETGHKITKSGLNHRFRKIKELALKLKKENEK